VVADDEAIGTDFSRYISFNYNCKNILIVSSHEDVNVDILKESLIENLASKGIKAEYRLMSSDPSVIKKSLYNIEILGNYDGIITLDYYTMEGAASGKLRINRDIKVFSVDNSQEAVYYLDSQGINALAFKDDYSMGFLAVLQITDKKEYGNMASNAPLYYIADRENMYSDELEKVLFPFVK
jgi:ribose transport system substrate-binding protein